MTRMPNDIQPLPIDQVVVALNGNRILVDGEVGEYAQRLQEIEASLNLRIGAQGGYIVYQEYERGGRTKRHLCASYTELGERVLSDARRYTNPNYDVAAEQDKIESRLRAEAARAEHERVGEMAERLHHAIRKDLQVKDRVYVPGRA